MGDVWIYTAKRPDGSTGPKLWQRATRVHVRHQEQWRVGAVVTVRKQDDPSGWPSVKTFAPTAPLNLSVPQNNQYTSTTLTWTASATATDYEVTQTLYADDKTTVVSTNTYRTGTTATTYTVPATEKRFYAYTVKAIGAGGLSSGPSNEVKWKVGNARKTRTDPVYGWSGQYAGRTHWPCYSSIAQLGPYSAQRMTTHQGWDENTWGFLSNDAWQSGYTASGSTGSLWGVDLGWTVYFHIYPQHRVLIEGFDIGWYCMTGWQGVFYPGWYGHSQGNLQLGWGHVNYPGYIWGPYNFIPGRENDNWTFRQSGTGAQQMVREVQSNEALQLTIHTAPITQDPADLGSPWKDIPYCRPNIKWVSFWWRDWIQTGWQEVETEAEVVGTTWS